MSQYCLPWSSNIGKKLGRQNQLEEISFAFREIGRRITAKMTTLRALLAAGLKIRAQLLPGTDRFGYEVLAGEGAYAGRRPRHEAGGTAAHPARGSSPAPPGAPPL